MNNKRTKLNTALLGGIVAISLLAPRAHADIIFFDDFSEDTTSTYTAGLPGTYNNLTDAPAGAPTNKLEWTSTPGLSSYQYQYGAGNVYSGTVGYAPHTTATNGSDYEVYLAPGGGNGHAQTNVASDITTPILTSTGAAVDLVAGATYTLSLDVGFRTDQTMSTLGIDLLAGNTVVNADPITGFTDEVTPTSSQQKSGIFENDSFTITAPLVGDSGALSLEFVNTSNQDQVNLSNIELSDTAAETPEPGTWAMLFGGLGVLFSFQRLRRGLKV